MTTTVLDRLGTPRELYARRIGVGRLEEVFEVPDTSLFIGLWRGVTEDTGIGVGVGWPSVLGEPTDCVLLPLRTIV